MASRGWKGLIASLAEHLGIPRASSGPSNSVVDACLASLSASSFPRMPWCPSTQMRVTSFSLASARRASRHSATSPEVTFGLLSALSAAWLSEKIESAYFHKPFLCFHMHIVEWHIFWFEKPWQVYPKGS